MEKVYANIGTRSQKTISILLFILVLSGSCLFLFIDNISWKLLMFIGFLSSLYLYGLAYYVLYLFRTKLTIQEDHFCLRKVFKSKKVPFQSIKGYVKRGEKIDVYLKGKEGKKVVVPNMRKHNRDISLWFSLNFIDLQKQHKIREVREIFSSSYFCQSPTQGKSRLRSLTYLIYFLNTIAIAFILVAYFINVKPWMIIITILFPVIAFALYIQARGVVMLYRSHNSIAPHISYIVFLPIVCLLIFMIDAGWLFNTSFVWPVCLVFLLPFFILFTIGLLLDQKSVGKSVLLKYVGLSFLGICYAVLATVSVNSYFDKSKAEVYTAEVIRKYVPRGVHSSCHLIISKWEECDTVTDYRVSRKLYKSCEEGDALYIHVKEGFLGGKHYFFSPTLDK